MNSGRSVPEWIGNTPDTKVPDRVRLRVFEKYGGKCYLTGIKITARDPWEIEHVIPLSLGGENRESNLAPALKEPHKKKTAEDVRLKSKSYRIRKRNAGIKKKSRFPGSKDSPFKIKLDGTVVKR